MEKVSFAVYESLQAKDERIIKRLIIALVISVVLLFLSNTIWVFTLVNRSNSSDVTVDSNGGSANYIGHNGDITYGESDSNAQEQNP